MAIWELKKMRLKIKKQKNKLNFYFFFKQEKYRPWTMQKDGLKRIKTISGK